MERNENLIASPEGLYQCEGHFGEQLDGCREHGWEFARLAEKVEIVRDVVDLDKNGVPIVSGYYDVAGDFFSGGNFYCRDCQDEWSAPYDVD